MAQGPVGSEAEFTTLLTSLTEDTVTASIHWRLYKDLWQSIPEFQRELNQSPAFWSLTVNAHREVAVFRLMRLYDDQPRALSLPTLLDAITANLHLFERDNLRERLKDNPFVESLSEDVKTPDGATLLLDSASVSGRSDPLVKQLLAVRNRAFVHRDMHVLLGNSKNPSDSLDSNALDVLLERAATIVNRYSIMFRASSSLMRIVGHDDFKRVLRHVQGALAAREQALAEEIARLGSSSEVT